MSFRRSFVRKFKGSGRFLQRGALFFIALALVFGLGEPGASNVLAQSSTNKKFDTNYKLSPFESAKEAYDPTLVEVPGEPLETPRVDNPRSQKYEDTSKRTPFSSTYINNDGSRTMEYGVRQQNYKKDGSWEKIDNVLKPVLQKAPEANLWQIITGTQPKAPEPEEFNGNAGDISVSMKSLADGITIKSAGKTITMKPVGANDVKPEKLSDSSVIFREAWPNVDIEYELYGETVKEVIILKNKNTPSVFKFDVSGGKVINHPTRSGELTIEGLPNEYSFSAVTLSLQDRGVISEQRVTQAPATEGKGIDVTVDQKWLQAQPSSSFPMRIDPTYNKDAQTYWMFKSDGYSCNASNCYANVGALYDNGWKNWRTYFQFPFSNLAGKKILNATLHGYYKSGIGGDTGGRNIWMGHANCISYNCRGSQVGSAGGVSTDFDINFTGGLQQSVDNSDWGTVWSLWGEEGAYKTYKPYLDIVAYITYDTPTAMAAPTSPANSQVIVDTQPSLKVNSITDADGDTVQYYFRVSTKPDAETGAVINSGWINSSQWTIPEGILQDGTTYYWHTYTRGATQTNPNWVRSFKVDLRTGKDSTQSYDTVGPVGIDLATGNATLSATTHSMSALGGQMGLNLTYNTPNKATKGLKGEYWNVSSSYNFANGAPTSAAKITRRDQNINFDWSTGSPAGGVNSDWYYVKWAGQFVAPVDGTYKFGGNNDDNMRIRVNSQELYNRGCYSGVCFDETKSLTLSAGQAVPIQVDYLEATSVAYAKLYVKGPVAQQIIPRDWLYADPSNQPQSYGLTGRYYVNTGDRNIDTAAADPSRLMMVRQDTNLNLNFGTGGPAQGLQSDNFMTRWTGYVTVPTSGSYKLGVKADDGSRIKIKSGATWTTLLDSWNYTNTEDRWGSSVTLTAGTPIPIVIDYNEGVGGASFILRVQDTTGAQMNIPTTWLTPNANVLPDQWSLGISSDGSVSYERIRIASNSVILEDSTGSTHEYTYTNGGYKPPVNEDGTLLKNNDNTYTFVDVDGRAYIFNAAGSLISLTAPSDDKTPAALKYEYAGDPSRLMKIVDGVTNTRYATVFYEGVNDTGSICDPNSAPNSPSTFFGLFSQFDEAPAGMMCALETSDGDVTNLYYKNGNLARVVLPGSQITDYDYDDLGRIITVRDPLASDAIGAGVRDDVESVTTQLSYDSLGRISTVQPPAANDQSSRPLRTITYGINSTDLSVSGASEPNGYSRRIQYDTLLRTTHDTDRTGKTSQIQWDPVKDLHLSTTDITGLKSTIIYDTDDRVVHSYGPAPAAWFDATTRKPLAAYSAQVPRVSTSYDAGLKGPAVTWYNLKSGNMTFVGAPKAYTTGFSSNNAPELGNPAYLRHDFRAQALPFTVDAGYEGYGFTATGKLRFTQSGTYTFTGASDDSIRLYINDQQVLSNWGTKTTGDIRNSIVGTFAVTAGTVYRFTYQYGHEGMSDLGSMGLDISGPGISGNTRDWSPFLQPGYNLATNSTAYDSYLVTTSSSTQYSNPAYGQVASVTTDPEGLNYTGTTTYESPGAGYLRQTSKTLPGGATTTYSHYSGADTRDNPCTAEVEVYHQAARPKSTIDPTGRSSEAIYNDSGEVVASRFNDDPWTCTDYDSRGRVISTMVPAANGKSGRTITNDYAVGGNPLITGSSDNKGTIISESDLLGRTVKYTDIRGNITVNTYDDYGKLMSRVSPVGTETFEYDNFDRLTKQKLDNVTFSSITYDEFSRINKVDYPGGMSLNPAVRDSQGRINKVSYVVNDQTISDEVTRSSTGLVLSGIENGVNKAYTYDKVVRLTSATIGANEFSYEYSEPDASCSAINGYNPSASKSGNRSSYTVNGVTTTYCYNAADQLVASSDPRFSQVEYDSHGNTTRLGDDTHKTEFSYDVSDRNTIIKETTSDTRETVYERDVNDRIYHRTYKVSESVVDESYYGFVGTGDAAAFLTDSSGNVVQKYLGLVGGVKVTIKPQGNSAGATTYSLSNIQGNTMATVNADGTPTILEPNGPFGERTRSQPAPSNAAPGTSNDYMGIHRKATEVDYLIQPVQMGARVYIPELGRFMQIDPIEGGTVNAYVYALDPINQTDVSGKFIHIAIFAVIAIVTIAIAAHSIYTAVTNPTPTNITIAVIDTVGAAAAIFTGGASVAASKAAGAGARAGASAAAQMEANRAAGKAAEKIALDRAKAQYAKDYALRTQQYYKVDGYSRGRFADITAYRNGQAAFNIEVKSGNARYGGTQLAKDQQILEQYGVPTVVWRIPVTGN
jgi:RHS repeat-associated protein